MIGNRGLGRCRICDWVCGGQPVSPAVRPLGGELLFLLHFAFELLFAFLQWNVDDRLGVARREALVA